MNKDKIIYKKNKKKGGGGRAREHVSCQLQRQKKKKNQICQHQSDVVRNTRVRDASSNDRRYF